MLWEENTSFYFKGFEPTYLIKCHRWRQVATLPLHDNYYNQKLSKLSNPAHQVLMINITAEAEQQHKATICPTKPEQQETAWKLQETGENQLNQSQVAFSDCSTFNYTSST